MGIVGDIIGWVIGIAGLLFAYYEYDQRKKADAERETAERKRADAEEERDRARAEAEADRERLQAAMEVPRIVVEYTGSRPEDGAAGRMLVKLRIANHGPTVADDVRFGIAVGEWRGAAAKPTGGGVEPQLLHALAAHSSVDDWRVPVPRSVVVGALNAGQPLRNAITALWVEFRDQRGVSHTRDFPPDC